jgi:hypothetical protein
LLPIAATAAGPYIIGKCSNTKGMAIPPTQTGCGGQTGMARSAGWSRSLSLRHTNITLTNSQKLSVASLLIYMCDRLLTQEFFKFPFDPSI